MLMLEGISIMLLAIGVPMLIMGLFIIGIKRIFEIEIINKFFAKLTSKIDKGEKKIKEFLLGFFIFLLMYIVSYPIVFILMIRDLVINRNTPEVTNQTYVNFYVIFTPLLLIWFSGFFYLINYFMYGNH